MRYILTPPDSLQATIQLPASKSISNRALLLHALSGGNTPPTNLSDCDDTQVMIRALEQPSDTIDIQAAGTAMRFLTAYFSVTPGTRLITGTQRMQQRPIAILVEALRTLGAQIEYAGQAGFPPLRITGQRLTGHEVSLAGNISSQYISALLMIGPILPKGLTVQLTGDIVSRPYIDLTLQLMHDFGARAEWTEKDRITVFPSPYQDTPFLVENDWSAASYWYETAALFAMRNHTDRHFRLQLSGLFKASYQGDQQGANLFTHLGVQTDYTSQGISLHTVPTTINRLEADLVNIPDLAQTFVVTCCLCNIPFCFTGLQSLRIKETDRLNALICELRKLGYVLYCQGDNLLTWDGERCQADPEPLIATYEDHRMAMAFAPASLFIPGLRIDQPQVVSKSYPNFWADLKKAGFGIIEES